MASASFELLEALQYLVDSEINSFKAGNLCFVYWGEREGEGLNPTFTDYPAIALSQLFVSPRTPDLLPRASALSDQFYLGVLKGNAGRIALTQWQSIKTQELIANIRRFVHLQRTFGDPSGIERLAKQVLVDPRKGGSGSDAAATAIANFAFYGKPIPVKLARQICDRMIADREITVPRLQFLCLYLGDTMATPAEDFAFSMGKLAFYYHWAQIRIQNPTGPIKNQSNSNVFKSLKTLTSSPQKCWERLTQNGLINLWNPSGGGITVNLSKAVDKEFVKVKQIVEEQGIDIFPRQFSDREKCLFMIGFQTARIDFLNPDKNLDSEEKQITEETQS